MNKYQDLITKYGFVLISSKGVESSGFDFNYDHESFDGCRMGQLVPLLFAQDKLHDIIQSNLIDSSSSGINECHMPLIPDDLNDAGQMGECFADMLYGQIPYKLGSREHFDFVNGLCNALKHHLSKNR
ncbi:TPA: hypothetical protein I7144_20700 [Vibrio vulnificus]|nr:hypothetical protein [Vibrio vulnificus]